jgi:hypothetical protein
VVETAQSSPDGSFLRSTTPVRVAVVSDSNPVHLP